MTEVRRISSTSRAKYYDPKKKRTIIIPIRVISELKPKIIQIKVGKSATTIKMAPQWFKVDNEDDALKNIVYPENLNENEQRTFDTVARYRTSINHTKNNFRKTPLNIKESNTETLVIALDQFAQQYHGDLSFTNEDLQFVGTADRTACGVADLGSAHLLATNYMPTAKFTFIVNLDYQTDLARSTDTMQNFALDFSNAIAQVLTCPKDYVRVLSIEKAEKSRKYTKVNFGITTPDPEKTEKFAQDLKNQARKPFQNHRLLKCVKPDEYQCKWKPLISFFQLQPTDFDPDYNNDYRDWMPKQEKRGGLPYYLPIGWYRHALKVTDKYPDDQLWLGHDNVKGEWAVAFHGTKGDAVKGITEKGLLITKVDAMRTEAVQQGGADFDKAGLYVATHCTGGAHPQYTSTFQIDASPEKIGKFRVVFQCRVKPGAFTKHRLPVNIGKAWRFVDPDAIRPYGILIKNEDTPDTHVEHPIDDDDDEQQQREEEEDWEEDDEEQ